MATKTKKGPIPLSEQGLAEDTVLRLKSSGVKLPKPILIRDEEGKIAGAEAGEIDVKLVRAIVKATKEEIVASITQGYSVNLIGLCSFVPKVVAGAKAGAKRRNPRTGEETVVKKDEPDTLGYRVGKSKSVTAAFPSLRTNAGKALLDQLRVPARKAKPKAATNGGGPKRAVA